MTENFAEVIGSLALEPVVIPALPEKLPVLNVTIEKFEPMTILVIDNFEGGYYHPDMKKRFSPANQKKLGDSGETLFGLDLKHGSALNKYPEWEQFWELVRADKQKNGNLWGYNYKPSGEVGLQLRKLAAAIMYKWFQYLSGKYIFISSMDEIANDDRLIIHFSYASWNGERWFERYAKALNSAISQYEGDKEMIFKTAIKARTESANQVIRQQGTNMLALFKKYKITG